MEAPVPANRARRLLDACVEAHGLRSGEYTYFFVSGEGRFLPISEPGDEVEESSGYVLDRAGRVFFFWFGWDPGRDEPALRRWRQVQPRPEWEHDPEYRRARERLHLLPA